MIQLWVNLPAKYKMEPPKYQDISSKDIPHYKLSEHAYLRVIAGEYAGIQGAAETHTPLLLGDVRFEKAGEVELNFQPGWSLAVYLLSGELTLNENASMTEGHLAAFGQEDSRLLLESHGPATVLILSGEPIGEPVASYGPFVMNTREELQQAFQDYQAGKMGRLS